MGGVVDKVEVMHTVSVPVYMKAGRGVSVSGMQFVADVVPITGALPVTEVTFEPGPNAPRPSFHGNRLDDGTVLRSTAFARWDNLMNPLTGEVFLGYIKFVTPNVLRTTESYSIRFRETGGAAIDPETGALTAYFFQSIPGEVWPWMPRAEMPRVADEWKMHFFKSLTSPAALPEEDADEDG